MLLIIKIIILALILTCCISIGFLKAKIYENRLQELKNIKNALEMLKSKIEFTYEPIKEIFEEISNIIYNNEPNIFKDTINLMDKNGVTESWNIAVNKNIALNDEDKSTIKMFGKLLGKTDKAGQINEINVTSILIDTLIKKAQEEKDKNFKLVKTLGSVIGVGICIILI